MAIRGPREPSPPQAREPRLREQPTSPIQRLLDFGQARTPAEARKLIAELLASMRAAGFPVPPTGGAEGQLGQALRLFQESRGLPPTGMLDRQTRDALHEAGLLPPPRTSAEVEAPPPRAEAPARFEGLRPGTSGELGLRRGPSAEVPDGAKSAKAIELEQAVDKSARERPPEVDLKSFLSTLRAAGFAGAGKGAEQLKDALRKLQRAEGLPPSGQLDRETARALVRRGIVDERVLSSFTPSSADGRAAAPDARHEPTSRGVPERGAEAAQGRGEDSAGEGIRGEGAAGGAGPDGRATAGDKGGQAQGAGATATGERGAAAAGEEGDVEDPWSAGPEGNAPAGDEEVDDLRRGHANVDDAVAREEDYWEVRSLREQIEAGLAAIARDDDGAGAATYAWDFSLFRPGIYGARQPAERLFHLVVTKAGAFDTLWEDARAALNAKLALLEPEGSSLERQDFEQALKRARYRSD
jgi:hypothetical protein